VIAISRGWLCSLLVGSGGTVRCRDGLAPSPMYGHAAVEARCNEALGDRTRAAGEAREPERMRCFQTQRIRTLSDDAQAGAPQTEDTVARTAFVGRAEALQHQAVVHKREIVIEEIAARQRNRSALRMLPKLGELAEAQAHSARETTAVVVGRAVIVEIRIVQAIARERFAHDAHGAIERRECVEVAVRR